MNKLVTETKTVSNRGNELIKILCAIKKDYMAWLLIVPSLLLFLFFVWQPMVSGVVLSFYKTKGFDAVEFVGLKNYIDVMSDSSFMKALTNSAIYTLWSLLLGFALPIVVSIMINEMVHLKSLFKFSVYFPTMVPGIATALLWAIMFNPGKGGLLNTLIGFIGLPPLNWLENPHLTIPLIVITMTWRCFGATSIIYLASLQGVNQELYESAVMDGAGILARVKNITLPQISNIIKLSLVMQIIGVFQTMAEPLAMTDGGPNNASNTLMLQGYLYAFRYFRADRSMATSVITFIILMFFTIIYFKLDKNNDD